MPNLPSLPIKKSLLEPLQSEVRIKHGAIHHHTWKDGFLAANHITRERQDAAEIAHLLPARL